VKAGADLYVRSCARCHEKSGTGKGARDVTPDIPDFTSHKWQEQRSDAQLSASILDGKGRDMPAFGDKFTREQVQGIVAYIRQFDPDKGKQSTNATQHTATPQSAPEPARVQQSPDVANLERRMETLRKEMEVLQKQFNDLKSPQKP
jgi:cytochrome c553